MRNQAIGMLQVGVSQWWVTKRFNVLLHSKPVIAQVFIQQNQQWIFQNMINRMCQSHVTKRTCICQRHLREHFTLPHRGRSDHGGVKFLQNERH